VLSLADQPHPALDSEPLDSESVSALAPGDGEEEGEGDFV
jgi:hypothetical protein